jgi:hypothetical protein
MRLGRQLARFTSPEHYRSQLDAGPNHRLYVSNFGAAPAGAGQILRFDISPGW